MLYNMEEMFIHLEPVQRLMPVRIRISNAGYLPRKMNWVRQRFDTLNFSFILKGGGQLIVEDRVLPVKAPCVLLQWPGVHYEYGPEQQGWWEEFFIICPPEQSKIMTKWGVSSSRMPLWPILNSRNVRTCVDEMLDCMRQGQDVATADRMDRICERMILESRLGALKKVTDPIDEKIERIRDRALEHLGVRADFNELARKEGISPISFRRHWARRFGTPPAKYLMDHRMQEACRLLVETTHTIGEIADQLGFEDALYFSRRFSRDFGMPATIYRRRFARTVS